MLLAILIFQLKFINFFYCPQFLTKLFVSFQRKPNRNMKSAQKMSIFITANIYINIFICWYRLKATKLPYSSDLFGLFFRINSLFFFLAEATHGPSNRFHAIAWFIFRAISLNFRLLLWMNDYFFLNIQFICICCN